jgi:hypothetical protein
MQAYPGKLHPCIDGWTSPNIISFLGLTMHWIRDGKLQSMILDFVKYVVYNFTIVHLLTAAHRAMKGHTGVYLAGQISECLHDFGIQWKVNIILLVYEMYY